MDQPRKVKKGYQKSDYEIALERIERARIDQDIEVDLSNLKLRKLPPEIEELTLVQNLKLENIQLSEFPPLERMHNLMHLDLSRNNLNRINGLELIRGLTSLDLSHNRIERIEGLDALKGLSRLDLSDNRINHIHNLDKLTNLEHLSLSVNELKNIEGIQHLKKLKSLDLSENQIESIVEIGNLPDLKHLILTSNQINVLGDFSGLKKLESLQIERNSLSADSLIQATDWCDYLKNSRPNFVLRIDGNPFITEIKGIKKADYSPDPKANHLAVFLEDYDAFIKHDTELVDVILPHKLVLIGNSNSGKSSLADYLSRGSIQKKEDRGSTQILEIMSWKPANKPEFFIYDFGGQDFYHSTYQLFFSSEASYILVWDRQSNYNHCNREKSDIRPHDYYCFDINYWLGNIRYLNDALMPAVNYSETSEGPEKNADTESLITPEDREKAWFKNLILVENKIDLLEPEPNHPLEVDLSFGEIESFKVSLLKSTDTPMFRTRRKWLREYLQHLHTRINKDTVQRANAIQDYLDVWPKLSQLANEWTYTDLKNWLQEQFQSWRELNDTEVDRIFNRFNVGGMLLWYRYDESLKERIWIAPLALQRTILNFLHHPIIEASRGQVTESSFTKVPGFNSLRELLVKQHIIFEDPHNGDPDEVTYIIPHQLPLMKKSNPLYSMAVQGLQTAFTIQFKHFMPMGIMNRLICMFGQLSEKKFYSRYEMVFTLKGEKILLHCDMARLRITVKMISPAADVCKELFHSIMLAYHRKVLELEQAVPQSIANVKQEVTLQSNVTTTSSFRRIVEMVPNDVQIALARGYFVNYTDLISAKNNKHVYVKGIRPNGKEKQIRAFEFNAFMDQDFARPLSVFISYSHDDIEYRKELQKYLINLQREHLIEIWQDGILQPGVQWDKTIKHKLAEADVVIMLVSQSFIASNYIHEKELRQTLEGIHSGKRIIPILIKTCSFLNWKAIPKEVQIQLNQQNEEGEMSQFQFLPHDESQRLKPINQWEYGEEAWVQISRKIRALVTGESGGV